MFWVLNETVLLSTQNQMLKPKDKKKSTNFVYPEIHGNIFTTFALTKDENI